MTTETIIKKTFRGWRDGSVQSPAPHKLGMVEHTCDPCTWEIKARESSLATYTVQDKPRLETLS